MKFSTPHKLLSFLVCCLLYAFVNAQTVQWIKKGSSPGFENGNAIVADDSGNVYVTGQIEFTSTFDSYSLVSYGQHDIFVAKYDPNGVIKWIKNAGGTDGDIGIGIGIDALHNVYITGEIETTVRFSSTLTLTSSGANDIFIAKYDANGNVQWAKKFGNSATSEKGRAIAVSKTGNCYITGNFSASFTLGSTTRSSNGGNDIFIVKFDSNGNPIWAKSAGGSKQDRGYGIALDSLENVYVTGSITSPAIFHGLTFTGAGNVSAFVAKWNSSGSFQWVKTGGACCDTTQAHSIALDPLGNIYIAGYFAAQTKFGTYTLTSSGGTDMFAAKYNSAGTVIWAKKIGGPTEDIAYGIACDPIVSRVYVTGSVATAGSAGTLSYPFVGYKDVFVGSFSSNSGTEKWVRTFGGHWRDIGSAIATNKSSAIFLTGLFNGTAPFGSFTLTSYPNSFWADFFVCKIIQPTPIPRMEFEDLFTDINPLDEVKVYPNPFSSNFTLNSQVPIEINIYDLTGKLVERRVDITDDINLGENMGRGIYLVVISDGTNKRTIRMVKE